MTALPGKLRGFLLRRCSAVTMERLVDPILTDIHAEAEAAAGRGQRRASRRIRVAGMFRLLQALVLYGWTRFWSFREWPDDDRRAVLRSMVYALVVTGAAIKLLMLPPLLRFPPSRYRELALYLVPQAIPIALPVGLLVGLLYGFHAHRLSLRTRTLVTTVAIACSTASLAAVGWIVPASNQAFRVAASRDAFIPKGLSELTLGELRSTIDLDERDGLDASRSRMTYHDRWALAAAPLVLTAWAFLLIGRLPSRGRWLLGIVAAASCVAYYTLMASGRAAVLASETLPPIAGAWLPNLVFIAAVVLLSRRTPNDLRRTAA